MNSIGVKYIMKNYKVTFSYEIEVEAEDEGQAEEIAYEQFSEGVCYNDIRTNEFSVDTEEVD